MKKILIIVSLIFFVYGCCDDSPSKANPEFMIKGRVKEVKHTVGGLLTASITVIYFTDGRVKVLDELIDVLYTDIEIYKQCIAGCYIAKKGKSH